MTEPRAVRSASYVDLMHEARADTRELVRVSIKHPRRASAIPPVKPIKSVDDAASLIAIVTLNDPDRFNALSPAMMVQINARLTELTSNPRIRAIILTGAGSAFCAGGALDLIRDAAQGVHADAAGTPGAGTVEPWRFIRMQFGSAVRTIANSVRFVINRAAVG